MRRLILTLILGWVCSGIGLAQAPDTLFISTSQTVHLRFASELKYVNLGSRNIVAKIVDGSKDFVAVKAREAFDYCTTMSCLEVSGKMHTFVVAYREHPERLEVDTAIAAGGPFPFEEYIGVKQQVFHIGTSGYGIDILCENIFVKDDVLLLTLSVKNGSSVSYQLSAPRFAVESARRSRRGLQYEKAVLPRHSYGPGTVAPGGVGKLVFAFDKLTLLRGQVFRAYFYEEGGSRNYAVTLAARDVNGAKRL